MRSHFDVYAQARVPHGRSCNGENLGPPNPLSHTRHQSCLSLLDTFSTSFEPHVLDYVRIYIFLSSFRTFHTRRVSHTTMRRRTLYFSAPIPTSPTTAPTIHFCHFLAHQSCMKMCRTLSVRVLGPIDEPSLVAEGCSCVSPSVNAGRKRNLIICQGGRRLVRDHNIRPLNTQSSDAIHGI